MTIRSRREYSYDNETAELLECLYDNPAYGDFSDHWNESLALLSHHLQPAAEICLKADLQDSFNFIVRPQPWSDVHFVDVLDQSTRSFEDCNIPRGFGVHIRHLNTLVKNQRNDTASLTDALRVAAAVRSIFKSIPDNHRLCKDPNCSSEQVSDAEELLRSARSAIREHYNKLKGRIMGETFDQRNDQPRGYEHQGNQMSGWNDDLSHRHGRVDRRDSYECDDHTRRGGHRDDYDSGLSHDPYERERPHHRYDSKRQDYRDDRTRQRQNSNDYRDGHFDDRRDDEHRGYNSREEYGPRRGSSFRDRSTERDHRDEQRRDSYDRDFPDDRGDDRYQRSSYKETIRMSLPKRPPPPVGLRGPSRTASGTSFSTRDGPDWVRYDSEKPRRSMSDAEPAYFDRKDTNEQHEDSSRYRERGGLSTRFSERQGPRRSYSGRSDFERSRFYESHGRPESPEHRSSQWGRNENRSGYNSHEARHSRRSTESPVRKEGYGDRRNDRGWNARLETKPETGSGWGTSRQSTTSFSGWSEKESQFRTEQNPTRKHSESPKTTQNKNRRSDSTSDDNPWGGNVSSELGSGWGAAARPTTANSTTKTFAGCEQQTSSNLSRNREQKERPNATASVFGASTEMHRSSDNPWGTDTKNASQPANENPWGTDTKNASQPANENSWGTDTKNASQPANENPWGTDTKNASQPANENSWGTDTKNASQPANENPWGTPNERIPVAQNTWSSKVQPQQQADDSPWCSESKTNHGYNSNPGSTTTKAAQEPVNDNPWASHIQKRQAADDNVWSMTSPSEQASKMNAWSVANEPEVQSDTSIKTQSQLEQSKVTWGQSAATVDSGDPWAAHFQEEKANDDQTQATVVHAAAEATDIWEASVEYRTQEVDGWGAIVTTPTNDNPWAQPVAANPWNKSVTSHASNVDTVSGSGSSAFGTDLLNKTSDVDSKPPTSLFDPSAEASAAKSSHAEDLNEQFSAQSPPVKTATGNETNLWSSPSIDENAASIHEASVDVPPWNTPMQTDTITRNNSTNNSMGKVDHSIDSTNFDPKSIFGVAEEEKHITSSSELQSISSGASSSSRKLAPPPGFDHVTEKTLAMNRVAFSKANGTEESLSGVQKIEISDEETG